MQESYKFSLFSVSHINLHELNRMFVPNQVEIEITANNLKYSLSTNLEFIGFGPMNHDFSSDSRYLF